MSLFVRSNPGRRKNPGASYPSVKALVSALGITREIASEVRDVMKYGPDLDSGKFPKTERWTLEAYRRIPLEEQKMSAINELVGGYGVEALWGNDMFHPKYEYVNLGETYTPTIMRKRGGRFFISDYGTVVERDREIQ
jgi:hypothetical protein